ncbi:MAG: RNA chaperone Hfq [Deltaproteobacteria bacterium]|nr:RNA chaperone Hfq [Deltaproteobacteria bacterium]
MKPRINVQDQFLNQARRERIKITMELSDGQKFEGVIKSFDNYCVILEGEKFHLIYKHAITNVNVPGGSRMAQLFGEGPRTATGPTAETGDRAKTAGIAIRVETASNGMLTKEAWTNALLVAARRRGVLPFEIDESLDELAELLRTAGGTEAGRLTCDLRRPEPATFIGKGKVGELAALAETAAADFIVFDDNLTPDAAAQPGRGLGPDGHGPHRAHPRHLRDAGAERRRQTPGGVGPARIPRAAPSRHVDALVPTGRRDRHARAGRNGSRNRPAAYSDKNRRFEKAAGKGPSDPRSPPPGPPPRPYKTASLIGYTNAGKSTLFNALTGAAAYADDRLFATLDPAVRSLRFADGGRCCSRTRSALSESFRTNSSKASKRPSRKSRRRISCCT